MSNHVILRLTVRVYNANSNLSKICYFILTNKKYMSMRATRCRQWLNVY